MLAHCMHHLVTALTVPLLPMIRNEFGLDYTRSGVVVSAFSIAYGFSQLPAGWLADRIGPRILITVGICGVALAGFMVGLSQTYIMILVFLALMGLLGGGYHPSAPPIISALVKPEHRGRVLGFHVIGGSSSHFLAPLIAAGIASIWGWRGSYITMAIPAIAFGIVFYMVMGRQTITQKPEHKTIATPGEAQRTPGHLRRLISFIALSSFNSAVVVATISFIPLFLVDHLGIAEEKAAAFIALIYSAGFYAAPLGGYLSDRFGRVPVILAVCLFSGPVIYLLTLVPYGFGLSTLLVAIGTIMFIRMPVSEAYIVGQTSARNRSTILGIYYFGGLEGSGLLTPVIGYLIDNFGFYHSFAIAGAALATMTLVCSIFLWGNRD
ncbi:MFS transporter [Chloroflexota bacterium]